jgi:hypothetical protein
MHECTQCGSDVTDQYWRVFAVDGKLHGCLHCEKKAGEHMPSDAGRESGSATA